MWYYALVNDAYDVLIEDAVACISRFICTHVCYDFDIFD